MKTPTMAAMFVLLAAAARADAPSVLVGIRYEPLVGSLHIAASIEWNDREQLAAHLAELDKRDVLYAGADGRKVSKEYTLQGKRIRVEMTFPRPENGRAINDYKEKLRSGMRSASGTMMSREEALRQKKVSVLTTDPEGAR